MSVEKLINQSFGFSFNVKEYFLSVMQNIWDAVRSWARDWLKRVLDVVVALVGLVLVAPLFLVIAVAIKLDSRGSIFYRQERVGQGGRVFMIHKFRTMHQESEVATGPVWAKRGDSRVSRIGAYLRRFHLDELPQLVNVLWGEMSLVGPRPERPAIVGQLAMVVDHYEHRLAVKPGITGLAQTRYRYDQTIADVRRKIRYDLLYIRNMCLGLDLRILLRTVTVVFAGRGMH